jgi:hypothetical protein
MEEVDTASTAFMPFKVIVIKHDVAITINGGQHMMLMIQSECYMNFAFCYW